MKGSPGGGGIGRQIMGEIGQVAKDVAKGVADAPRQLVEGPAKQSSNGNESSSSIQSGDTEGAALEAGQQLGDATQSQKQAQQTSGQGWGDAFKAQMIGEKFTQRRIAEVRRNLEQEVKQIHQQNVRQAEQQKQQEEQQKEMVTKQQVEQKKEVQKQSKVQQILGMGKGERKGTKGK